MRIVDRKTLSTMPNGTLFCRYIPDMLDGDWNIITGHNEGYNGDTKPVGFYSVLPVEPFLDIDKDTKPGTERITNWRTTDTCDFDFDE